MRSADPLISRLALSLFVDVFQIRMRQCSNSVHHRRLSSVHLDGLSILFGAQAALRICDRREHNSNVYRRVLLSLVVLLSNGTLAFITLAVGCMTNVAHVKRGLKLRSTKSSLVVTQHQVRRATGLSNIVSVSAKKYFNFFANSACKLCHTRSVAYSVDFVLLNKNQISGG